MNRPDCAGCVLPTLPPLNLYETRRSLGRMLAVVDDVDVAARILALDAELRGVGDRLRREVVTGWYERGAERVLIVCSGCAADGRFRRATLGAVWASPVGDLLAVELVSAPRAVPAVPRAALAADLVGWGRRGDPWASQRVLVLDWNDDAGWAGWPDDDPPPWALYCPAHSLRVTTFGEIRAARARPARRYPFSVLSL